MQIIYELQINYFTKLLLVKENNSINLVSQSILTKSKNKTILKTFSKINEAKSFYKNLIGEKIENLSKLGYNEKSYLFKDLKNFQKKYCK